MQLKMYFSFLMYAHVCITIMVEFQKVMHVTVDQLLTRSNHGTSDQAHSLECWERSIVALFVCSQRHAQFFVRRVRVRWPL